jgi:hypothetical protein
MGRSEGFAMVELDKDCEAGSVVNVQVNRADREKLYGVVA